MLFSLFHIRRIVVLKNRSPDNRESTDLHKLRCFWYLIRWFGFAGLLHPISWGCTLFYLLGHLVYPKFQWKIPLPASDNARLLVPACQIKVYQVKLPVEIDDGANEPWPPPTTLNIVGGGYWPAMFGESAHTRTHTHTHTETKFVSLQIFPSPISGTTTVEFPQCWVWPDWLWDTLAPAAWRRAVWRTPARHVLMLRQFFFSHW